MPYLHIQISGPPDDALAQRVASVASELTHRLLAKDPALTAVAIDFVPASQWFIAGQRLGAGLPRSYHWTVSITDETNTKAEKARYLAAVHQAMDELLGGAAEHSYTHVVDARASAYGYGGRTQEWRYQHSAPVMPTPV
ncbi:4-oxalocrotonate tautomerase [Ideonella sp. DXS29W]|uniref:4-oxalocrotonate tautomerase n=1 Tax=Ideonella lacteola TaxID=2984193 RepID=A0ABU9C0Z4_9BURK